ncbi:MAG: MBL fold metallo-hydrolase [Dehalococcoidia bacterium]|nr:MAG: MBL fold metallo-hydrolase [Dehalococcoidia bacterium]
MKIRFLGAHNTETSGSGLLCLLLDESVALDAGCLTSKLSLKQQLALKAVLFTHGHYDHIRDLPMLAMNCFLNEGVVHAYGSQAVKDALAEHILNGQIYSRFFERPVLDFHTIEPYRTFIIDRYEVTPVPVNHSVPSTGYQVKSAGRSFFYTGDTGPGLSECWSRISPDLLIIEVTASNRFSEFGRESKHLTPELLKEELISFREIRGYLPKVITVHMNPSLEADISGELKEVARALGCDISLAREGLEIKV